MSDAPSIRQRPPAPMSDLFATAVHRFGKAWADLVVATAVFLALGTVPVLAATWADMSRGVVIYTAAIAYGVAYFALLAYVILRGLPAAAPRRRVVAAYLTAVAVGVLGGLALTQLVWVLVAPLLLFAVPSVAAGDQRAVRAIPAGARLAVGNVQRTWAGWCITLMFSGPVAISMWLLVAQFTSEPTSIVVSLALAAPIVWPFSALFIRALYGDLTGRLVVAPQDRTR